MSLRIPYILTFVFIALSIFGLSHAQDNQHEIQSSVQYVSAIEAKSLLAMHPDILILDVRTHGEHKRAHIDGAIQINYFSPRFKTKLRALNRNQTYLVHCKSGHRSNKAVKTMQKLGFENIIHLDGGFDAWKKLPSLESDDS